MSEHDLISYLIPGFATVISAIGLGIFQQLRQLAKLTQKLSVSMAVIADRVDHHERRINRLEGKRLN